jgi:hypothetical protein
MPAGCVFPTPKDSLIYFSNRPVYVGNSTIPQAGKGAFSRRTLKKDTVIHTSPVIGTTRWHMAILDNYTDIATINSKQLITNYHFGHPNSTILFYPLTQMIAVNHKSSRTAGAGPNARVEFSSRDAKTKYLLQRPIEDIFDEKYSAMLLDIVATRDIAPDEEVRGSPSSPETFRAQHRTPNRVVSCRF